ncbi:hypothetical protein AB0C29_34705 [Actinoplanes sp. NPDC048791]|uniref:hypothetical protein n=1 Tax=Actinoplanes sp. NPDC048791 TaxID=3154623 RepID=UPI0033E59DD1
MAARRYGYSVGNESDPGDPWGRSELSIEADGRVSLRHHFPGPLATRGWTGRVEATMLEALRGALEEAGFPDGPSAPPVAGSGLRRLTVGTAYVALPWHLPAAQAAYAKAFDLLDGVIHELTAGAVAYSTTHTGLVSDINEAPGPSYQ